MCFQKYHRIVSVVIYVNEAVLIQTGDVSQIAKKHF